jgi:hypothetical protein
MATITIPKELTQKGELVVIPRKEYEEFSNWREAIKSFKLFIPTTAQKRDLKKARQDYKKGKYLTINELKRKLGITS